MWDQIKADFRRRPKVFLGAFALMGALLALAAWQLRPYLPMIWPRQALIVAEREAVAKAHQELQARIDRACELIRNQESLLAREREFWLAGRDGNVETEPQKLIEDAAKKAGVQLTSVGNVQSEKIGEIGQRLYLAVSATAPLGALAEFMEEVEACRPRFYWRTLTMRPDNVRTYEKVVFNANLEFIQIGDEETVALLMNQQP